MEAQLLEAYQKVSTDDLYRMIGVIEDALIEWEHRVITEPYLRIRIRKGYECIALAQETLGTRMIEGHSDA